MAVDIEPMIYFTDARGQTHPISRIVTIRKPRVSAAEGKGGSFVQIELEGGAVVDVSEYEVDRIQQAPIKIFPALAGTAFIYADTKTDQPHTSDIIAWALCADGEIRGVTPSGVDDGHVSNADTLRMPDGSILIPNNTEYPNEAEWLKDKFSD